MTDQTGESQPGAEAQGADESQLQEPTGEQQAAEPTEGKEEQTAEPAKGDEEGRKQRRKERNNRRLQHHLSKVEARLAEAEKRLAYYDGRDSAQQHQAKPEDTRPKSDDFESWDEYLEALTDWKIEQRESKAQPQKQETRRTDDAKQPVYQPDPTAVQKYQQTGQEKYGDDFAEMMEAADNGEFAVSMPMADTIFDSDHGADIAMYLYDHPDEAMQIAQKSPARQVRDILALEAKLKATPPAKRVSGAPAPHGPERGGSAPAKNLSDVKDTATWIEMRNKQVYGN